MSNNGLAKVTVILRGYNYQQIKTVCEVLVDTPFNSVEITTNSPDAFISIAAIKKEFSQKMMVGVGTVLTMEHAVQAVNAKADFILSPIALSADILKYCQENKIITVPAAMTPTEIYQMFQQGADIVKVFPANALPKTFAKDVQAPLGKLPLMAVGGINQANAKEHLNNGYQYVGVASGMFNKADIINMNKQGLQESLTQWLAIVD